jgi:hypothetical protein
MFEHDRVTRREALIGAASGLALAALESQRAEAEASPADQVSGQVAGQVSGQVFEDRDASGRPSAANPGIPGVLVSNGPDEGGWADQRCVGEGRPFRRQTTERG